MGDRHRVRLGVVEVYVEPRDWWVGYYRGERHHYVCMLPTLVTRWPRLRYQRGVG